jgi:hypothetical protein
MMDNSNNAKAHYVYKHHADPPTKVVPLTQRHIESGRRKDPDHCPLALAFRGAGFDNARVLDNRVEYDHPSEKRMAALLLGSLLTEELKAYDEGRFEFIPYTYELLVSNASFDRIQLAVARMGNDEGRRAA